MRLLHLTGEFPPYVSGGLATYVAAVVERLERDHDVDVALMRGNSLAYAATDDGSERGPDVTLELDPDAVPEAVDGRLSASAARSVVDGELPSGDEYDAIHVHDWYGVLPALTLTGDGGPPMVVSSHLPIRSGFTYSGHEIPERSKLRLEALGFQVAARVLVPSEFVAQVLRREYDVPPARITVVPNGVDTERFTPDSGAKEDTGATVLTVARLTEQKGLPYLLDAAETFSAGTTVEIVGDGPLRADLEATCRSRSLGDTVRFRGYLPDDDLLNAYRRADVFAFPSVYEPFGLVALEAMACGTPVVAFDAGGVREVLMDDDREVRGGLLAPPGDVEAFGRALRTVVTNPDRSARLSREARELATEFDWRRTVTDLTAVYRAVAGGVVA
jgi:glycosyltransferase involved in cell wall biosynthesis